MSLPLTGSVNKFCKVQIHHSRVFQSYSSLALDRLCFSYTLVVYPLVCHFDNPHHSKTISTSMFIATDTNVPIEIYITKFLPKLFRHFAFHVYRSTEQKTTNSFYEHQKRLTRPTYKVQSDAYCMELVLCISSLPLHSMRQSIKLAAH